MSYDRLKVPQLSAEALSPGNASGAKPLMTGLQFLINTREQQELKRKQQELKIKQQEQNLPTGRSVPIPISPKRPADNQSPKTGTTFYRNFDQGKTFSACTADLPIPAVDSTGHTDPMFYAASNSSKQGLEIFDFEDPVLYVAGASKQPEGSIQEGNRTSSGYSSNHLDPFALLERNPHKPGASSQSEGSSFEWNYTDHWFNHPQNQANAPFATIGFEADMAGSSSRSDGPSFEQERKGFGGEGWHYDGYLSNEERGDSVDKRTNPEDPDDQARKNLADAPRFGKVQHEPDEASRQLMTYLEFPTQARKRFESENGNAISPHVKENNFSGNDTQEDRSSFATPSSIRPAYAPRTAPERKMGTPNRSTVTASKVREYEKVSRTIENPSNPQTPRTDGPGPDRTINARTALLPTRNQSTQAPHMKNTCCCTVQ